MHIRNYHPQTFYDENEGLYYAVDVGNLGKSRLIKFTDFDQSRATYGALDNEEVEVISVDWKTYEATISIKSLDGVKGRSARVKFSFTSPEKFWELFYQAFGKRAHYSFELSNGNLEYSDKNVSVLLQPSEFGIGIKIRNNLNDPISVEW